MNVAKQALAAAVMGAASLMHAGLATAAPSAQIRIDTSATITVDHAAALMAVATLGEQLPAQLALELAKFARDLEQNENVEQAQAPPQSASIPGIPLSRAPSITVNPLGTSTTCSVPPCSI